MAQIPSSLSAWDHVAISDITEEISRHWSEQRPGHVGLGAGEESGQPRARLGHRGQADQLLLLLPEDLRLPAPVNPGAHQVRASALPESAR